MNGRVSLLVGVFALWMTLGLKAHLLDMQLFVALGAAGFSAFCAASLGWLSGRMRRHWLERVIRAGGV